MRGVGAEGDHWLHCTAARDGSASSVGGTSGSQPEGDDDTVYALDAVCYHTGGPLVQGDIEDIDGRPCIRCPWHEYRITMDTGEGMYMALEGHYKSKGTRQRTHTVRVQEGRIQVALQTVPQPSSTGLSDNAEVYTGSLPSDVYAFGPLYPRK